MIQAGDSPSSEPLLLKMRGIVKSFPGVKALRGVDLELRAGEVLALLGENGAGKSTLIKVLAGAHLPDEGEILLDGRPANITSPVDAQRAGIGVIYQEFNLVPGLTARENIFLGRERTTATFIHRRDEQQRARELFARTGVPLDPEALCRQLTVAQQQVVEIAKALAQDARILVMDEPSATLTPTEVERLFVVIRELQRQGVGIIYISHRLEEIYEIADRVTVLRDGQYVGSQPIGEVNREKLIEMMVGRKLEQEFPPRKVKLGEERLVVKNLSRGREVQNVSFGVRAGEIVALAGLVGAGRTETARLIFAADRPDSGQIWLDGKLLEQNAPREAIANGICLLSEDRKGQGLVLGQSVRMNFGLPNLRKFSWASVIDQRQEKREFDSYIESLRIRVSDREQLARNLSGGNQQKVVLAKWLAAESEVIIFDEPTRGIDVGAKYEIYLLMNRLAEQGKVILMISSELPEVLGMSDRILVMHEGRIAGEVTDVASATQEQILDLAVR